MSMENQLLGFARDLIRINSVTGGERTLVEFARQKMLDLGYDEAYLDEAGNVIGVLKGKGNYKILFDAHVDTVDVGDKQKWSFDPFGGEVHNDKLYGRGAADMKGAFAAMICAGASLIKQKESLPGTIYISGTVSEEIAEGRCFEVVLDRVKPDYVVIGEASELNLKIGQRGRAEIVLNSYGKSAHSSNPQLAVNAAENLVDAITRIRTLELPVHPLLGKAIMTLTDCISHPYPGRSVIPYKASCTYDRRLMTGESENSVLEEINRLLGTIQNGKKSFDVRADIAEDELVTHSGYKVLNRRFFPAWALEAEHPFCKIALRALKSAGLAPDVTAYQFCTNGSSSAGKYGIPTVGFGPGTEDMAHVVDEYISLAELNKAAEGYKALMNYSFL